MKIAIVVQGRFHAFDLARALLARGHDVTVFTNYPKWAVRRFGLSPDRVRGFWLHGVTSRMMNWVHERIPSFEPERWLHPIFGRWAASRLNRETWDVIHSWSGVAEDIGKMNTTAPLKLVMRGSAHIRVQDRILAEEETRTGCQLDRPGPWITAREEREYRAADRIVVLSTFAYQSFLEEGFERSKLAYVPLGANTSMFRPYPEIIEARCRRILSGAPIRILYVGALSLRKGVWDFKKMVHDLAGDRFRFRLVGPVTRDARLTTRGLPDSVELIPKQPQSTLPTWYAWGDVFVFPTVEDGFAAVLAQAKASGLPILTTTNCSGPDLMKEGETGWVLPIRSPQAFVDRLRWCDSHREELAEMVRHSYQTFRPRDWAEVATDFETLCVSEIAAKRPQEVSFELGR